MISLGIFGKSQKENEYLRSISKEKIALYSKERWNISAFTELEEFKKYIEAESLLHVVYIDVTVNGAVELAEEIRSKNSEVVILLIADTSISPVKYIRPSIMAASLLLRPLKKHEVNEQVSEVIKIFADNAEKIEGYFNVEYKGEKVSIPYDNILYFESRDKKIFVGLENVEYGFYDTMNALEERLPDCFVRCSRSFIFNHKKLKRISLNESIVELVSGVVFPISRGYKKKMREL